MAVALPELLNPFTVACTFCGAVAGEQCRNDITKQPLKRAIAHPIRIRDAYPDIDSEDGDDD